MRVFVSVRQASTPLGVGVAARRQCERQLRLRLSALENVTHGAAQRDLTIRDGDALLRDCGLHQTLER